MRSLEEFFRERNRRTFPGLALNAKANHARFELHPDLRQAVNRGLRIFPVTEIAKLTGQPDQLIGEATCDVSRLEELAAEYPFCLWSVALGPSNLCVLRVYGYRGRASLATLSQHEEDTLTLRAECGDTIWALFRHPKHLKLRTSARKLAPGIAVFAKGESSPIPPSPGSKWLNPWAEIEAVPYWLRKLAFEDPDDPPGEASLVSVQSPRLVPCRSVRRVEQSHRRAITTALARPANLTAQPTERRPAVSDGALSSYNLKKGTLDGRSAVSVPL